MHLVIQVVLVACAESGFKQHHPGEMVLHIMIAFSLPQVPIRMICGVVTSAMFVYSFHSTTMASHTLRLVHSSLGWTMCTKHTHHGNPLMEPMPKELSWNLSPCSTNSVKAGTTLNSKWVDASPKEQRIMDLKPKHIKKDLKVFEWGMLASA
jgi:hypothetical protein